jgi:hypothetical protein
LKKSNWKDIAELIGLGAIVASLVFVGLQMRQEQIIARAELGSSTFDHLKSIDESLRDPSFTDTYAKMVRNETNLSYDERIALNAFLNQVASVMMRECYLVYVGVFPDCMLIADRLIPTHFGNSYAKVYWHMANGSYPQPVVELLTPIIDRQSDGESARLYTETNIYE